MANLLNKKNVIIAIIIIVVGGIGWSLFFQKDETGQYETTTATRSDLKQEVSVTGDVVPAQDADLAFEQAGSIGSVYVNVGDKVYAGQSLVAQKSDDAYAKLLGAQSDLDTQKAVLLELEKGTRAEELIVYEVKLNAAENSVAEARTDAVHKIKDAFTRSDNAVRNDVDQLFSNSRSTNPSFKFSVSDQQLKTNLDTNRFLVESMFGEWEEEILIINKEDVETHLISAKNNAQQVKELLAQVSLAVNALESGGSLTQTTIDGYKTDVSSARTSINTAITNLNTVSEKLTTAQASLLIAQKELDLKEAGTSDEQIAAQEAKVKSAEATVFNYETQLKKTILKAPFAGTITRQDAKVGEIATAGKVLVSLISNKALEIEIFIPEADIAKVLVGNDAVFTLDAYEDDVIFDADVYAINPSETVIEGVATYKTKLSIRNADERIRAGMTANVEILTAQKSDVIAIPARAVTINGNDRKYVKILNEDGSVSERDVETGLRGSEGFIEIVSGVEEEDLVITFIRK